MRSFKICAPDVAPSTPTLISPSNGQQIQSSNYNENGAVSITFQWNIPSFGFSCYGGTPQTKLIFSKNADVSFFLFLFLSFFDFLFFFLFCSLFFPSLFLFIYFSFFFLSIYSFSISNFLFFCFWIAFKPSNRNNCSKLNNKTINWWYLVLACHCFFKQFSFFLFWFFPYFWEWNVK